MEDISSMSNQQKFIYFNNNTKYINDCSEDLKLYLLSKDGRLIRFIKKRSLNEKLTAVRQNPFAIKFIRNTELEVQLEAIKKNLASIYVIFYPYEEIKKIVAENIDFNYLMRYPLKQNHTIQCKIRKYITKEIYYKAPKDFPWIQEIKNKFKDVDRFKRFNL